MFTKKEMVFAVLVLETKMLGQVKCMFWASSV